MPLSEVSLSVPPRYTPTEAAPGLMLASGKYQLIEAVGKGGFGRVWRARDTSLDVDVAIKEVYVPPGTTPEETAERVERAAREARSAARMRDHPNIVTVHDVVVERGVPWTVMQYVPGRSLEDEIKRGGPASSALAKKVAVAMLRALDACHRAGIMHRDVKPANIMLAEDGTVLLADFGIAKQSGQSSLTAPDMLIASVEYIAPERARGKPANPGSDLFSLGVTLYQAVEGVSPFDRGSGMASLSAVLMDELPPMERAKGKLARIVAGLTEKDPDRRMTAEQALLVLEGPGGKDAESPGRPTAPVRPKARLSVPRDVVRVTASRASRINGGVFWWGGGLGSLAVGIGVVFALSGHGGAIITNFPGTDGAGTAQKCLIAGGLASAFGVVVGIIAALAATSDTITLDSEKITILRSRLGGEGSTLVVRWDALENLTVDARSLRVWLRPSSEHSESSWMAKHGITRAVDGSYVLYVPSDMSMRQIHPRILQSALRPYAAMYG